MSLQLPAPVPQQRLPRRARLRVHVSVFTMLFDLPPGTAVIAVEPGLEPDEALVILEGAALPVPPAMECPDGVPFVDLVLQAREPQPGERIPHLAEIRVW